TAWPLGLRGQGPLAQVRLPRRSCMGAHRRHSQTLRNSSFRKHLHRGPLLAMTGLVIARSSLSVVLLVLRRSGGEGDGGTILSNRQPVFLRMHSLRGFFPGEGRFPNGRAVPRPLTLCIPGQPRTKLVTSKESLAGVGS